MTVLWILVLCGLVLLPGTALLALDWAVRHGEFKHLHKIALSIFDDDEPLGQMTDHFPGQPRPSSDLPLAAGDPPDPNRSGLERRDNPRSPAPPPHRLS